MEKWQLAGIISGESRSKLALPSGKLLKEFTQEHCPTGPGAISKAIQKTLRKMTEVIALF
ncbi:MAG: hypothetical protein ABFS18_01690 [Thermodesulfobacteriota bacterium]